MRRNLCISLAKNHAFQDGNKRVAAYAAETFVLVNDLILEATNEQLYVLYLGIAAGIFTREQAEAVFQILIADPSR
ncbi:MAG TPA: Fic family protein [Blastocatellia bacterium]|nr:Fic family protein [Blastocatellia bacterium]